MDNKKFDLKIEDGKLKLSLDLDKDGEALLKLELNLKEGLEEAFGAFFNKAKAEEKEEEKK